MSWLLTGLAVLVLAAALVLLGLNVGQMDPGRIGVYAILAVAVGLYAGTGRLITARLPANAIGWLLGLIGLSLAVTMMTEQYALYGLATAPGSMPAAKLAGWFSAGSDRTDDCPAVLPDVAVPGRAAAVAPVAAGADGRYSSSWRAR